MITDHPHKRGEYVSMHSEPVLPVTDHPHKRGEYVSTAQNLEACRRITPTSVGNTYSATEIKRICCGSPPQAWGIRLSVEIWHNIRAGSPPQAWGIRAVGTATMLTSTDHPHKRGEYTSRIPIFRSFIRVKPIYVPWELDEDRGFETSAIDTSSPKQTTRKWGFSFVISKIEIDLSDRNLSKHWHYLTLTNNKPSISVATHNTRTGRGSSSVNWRKCRHREGFSLSKKFQVITWNFFKPIKPFSHINFSLISGSIKGESHTNL